MSTMHQTTVKTTLLVLLALALATGAADDVRAGIDARDLEPVRAETPRLRIGVLTDTHIAETRASCEDVARVYRFFRSVGVDAIVNCGDIAHRYNPKGYAHYRDIRRETYPDPQTAPRELFVMAGHDSMGFPGGRESAPWTNTYAHVRAALGIDHEMYADVIVKGCHCLVFPQSLDFARAEKMLATACVDTPGKPVFVFDHIPAFGTTEGSVSDGCPNRRRLYAKFPQSVVVTGHNHVCLRNPLNLWQGEFVTVGGGCFANWEGETTGAWRGGSRLRHFLVIEVFDDRLVFRRYDLDGGPEEIGVGRPWTVDWPRTGAPAEEPVAAVPAFPPGATLVLTNAPGAQGDVEIRFPAAVTPETPACYRICVAHVSKDGAVQPLAVQDLPAEFVLPKAKRRQVFADSLNGGLFTPGETYRVSVAPVGFRGERGRELSATWIGKPAARMPLVWLGVPEEARQNVPIELRQGREVRLKLPADIWERVPAGARVRVVADIDFEQADDSIVTFSLYGDKTGDRYPWQVVSPQGNSSLRYAFDATLPKVKQTYSLAFRKGGGARIVIRSVRIETKDPLPVPVGKAGAPRLFFAGDSTLDDHGRSLCGLMQYPNQSWGTTLQAAMVDGCVVRNYARSGASTKSFEASGVWKQLVDDVRPGDFVAIEFGHNDQKRGTEFYLKNRWSDPKGLFREIVRRWVGEVRAKGATPILLSPICRGTFDAAGKKLVDTTHASDGVCLGSYRDAMRELSEELGCSFVDMNTLTKDLMERLGKEASMQFFVISTGIVKGRDGEPSKDITHPVRAGAEAFAKLFLDDVKARKLPVAALFR